MIDLEKERELFENKNLELDYGFIFTNDCFKMVNGKYESGDVRYIAEDLDVLNIAWSLWLKRAELAQQEVESLSSKHGSVIGKIHFTEKNLGKAQQEISELKAKIAKYESDDVVVLPRIPSDEMVKFAENYHSCIEISNHDVEDIYQAMIEAGEIK